MRERPAAGDVPLLTSSGFVAAVDPHQPSLLAFLSGLLGDPEQARDVAQDTLADAWRAARDGTPPFLPGTPPDEVRRWLFHAAYCNAVTVLRRRRLIRWQPLDDAPIAECPPTGAPITFEDQLAEGEALRAALAALSPPDVACLLLRVVQGFSAAEAGRIVGATPDVVTTRLSRAKQRLRTVYLAQNIQSEERKAR
jgi:RNA polymerase sigma-70 factor, ECF subfamily